MAFYPCFISFRHFDDELAEEFVNQFHKSLTASLNPYFGAEPFIDFKRIKPGYQIDPTIADAICNSACMIMIWSPQYFNEDHLWCTMEYKAMIELEETRRNQLPLEYRNRRLIIPVIYKGSKFLPTNLKGTHVLNFEKFALYESDMLRNKNYIPLIEELAAYIFELFEAFKQQGCQPWGNCNGFQLPSVQDTKMFLQRLTNNTNTFPFRTNNN